MTFFILGNNPALSIAEIINVYKGRNFINGKNFTLMDSELDAEEEIKKLGGIIKIGKTITELPLAKANKEILEDKILEYINLLFNEKKLIKQNKVSFGFSFSGYKEKFPKKGFVKDIAMGLKKLMKEEGISARWAVSKEDNLSSAAVHKNNLFIKSL